MERRYDFEGSVYIDVDELKLVAKQFFEAEGSGQSWDDLNNFLWDNYSDYLNWDQVIDDITSDIFEFYEELVNKESEEE